MQNIEICSRWDNKIIIVGEYESIKDCLEKNRDADLGGADLRDADLGGADLKGADLGGAYLGGAHLGDADLGGAHLGGADLRGAYLGGADLGGADLGGAYLKGAHLGGAYLEGADLGGAYLGGAHLGGAYLEGADLGGAYLGGAHLGGAKNYYMSHDFTQEIIRRQPIKTFTSTEWAIIGQILVYQLCWETIKKEYGKKATPIFKKIKKAGFGEFLEHYEKA